MADKIEFDERIIDLIRKKLKVQHNMNLSDFNQFQIIEFIMGGEEN